MQTLQIVPKGEIGALNQKAVSCKSADRAIDLVQRAVDYRQNIGIKAGAAGELYVFPNTGEYLDLLIDREAFFATPAKELQVEILKDKDIRQLTETICFGRNLDKLLLDELLA